MRSMDLLVNNMRKKAYLVVSIICLILTSCSSPWPTNENLERGEISAVWIKSITVYCLPWSAAVALHDPRAGTEYPSTMTSDRSTISRLLEEVAEGGMDVQSDTPPLMRGKLVATLWNGQSVHLQYFLRELTGEALLSAAIGEPSTGYVRLDIPRRDLFTLFKLTRAACAVK